MTPLSEHLIRWAGRLYRLMLHAYPPAFHAEYGGEMLRVFRERTRDALAARGAWAIVPIMMSIAGDWMKTVIGEHMASNRPAQVRFDLLEIDRRFALVLGLLPAVAFVVSDFILQLPDNHHEPTLGFFMTLFFLVSVWALTGFMSAGDPVDWRTAMKAGALSGILSVAVLAAVFIVLNNAFPVRMSYEPDRIRAFNESGYNTLRMFINRELVLSGFFPVLATVAALLGATGGALRALMARWSTTG